MSSPAVHVPRIRLESPTRGRVTRWGQVSGFVYRAGDSLVLAEPTSDSLLLLVPRGWGNPMLGRQRREGLVAEPGGVPASTERWQVAGRVAAVERDLERAVAGPGHWSVSVVLRPLPHASLVQVRAAEARLQGGQLTGAELDALCLRAALAEDDVAVRVSIGAASTQARADALADAAEPGRIRMDISARALPEADLADVIVGPWGPPPVAPAAGASASERRRLQLSLFGDRRRRHAN